MPKLGTVGDLPNHIIVIVVVIVLFLRNHLTFKRFLNFV